MITQIVQNLAQDLNTGPLEAVKNYMASLAVYSDKPSHYWFKKIPLIKAKFPEKVSI